jgi:PEP-CTERM motif
LTAAHLSCNLEIVGDAEIILKSAGALRSGGSDGVGVLATCGQSSFGGNIEVNHKILAALPLVAAAVFSQQARADVTKSFTLTGGGLGGTVTVTYDPSTTDPTSGGDVITQVSGTFSDSNIAGLGTVKILGLVPTSHNALPPTGPAGTSFPIPPSSTGHFPTALSYFYVANEVLAPHQPPSPFMSYDNLWYPDGAPIVCSDYFGNGSVLDPFGLAFYIDYTNPTLGTGGDYAVDLFSNGAFGNFLPSGVPVFGAVVSDINTNYDYVAGGVALVPEPSTWAMMVLGFAGLGFAGYGTRKTASVAA